MPIDSFRGRHTFLSNFHTAWITIDGAEWPTTEHYFAAQKTLDRAARERIRTCTTPGRAKRAGRAVTIRKDWEQVKVGVMLTALQAKFRQHPALAEALLDTGHKKLIEGNTWHDNFWGSCTCGGCENQGTNMLGRLLMVVRAELRHER